MSDQLESVDVFLNSNIKSKEDLNLDKLKQLLDEQKSKQNELDAELQELTKDSKIQLNTILENTVSQQDDFQQLLVRLKETSSSIKEYETTQCEQESPSFELLSQLSRMEEKLRRVDAARNYVKALLVVCELSSQALDLVKTDPEKAIRPYEQLVKFKRHISNQQVAQENHSELCEYLKKRQIRLWEELYAVLVQNFKDSLEDMSWPTPIKPPYEPQLKNKLNRFEQCFKHLVILQQSSTNKHDVDYLSPISIMLEGISLRFKYHFETAKPTNRLDKPEWYLSHVKNSIATHMPFLLTTVQPIVNSMDDYVSKEVSIKDLFIQGLLQDITRKLQKTMPQIIQQPSVLSHTIHQVLSFDKDLTEEFAYDKGISSFVLNNSTWFNAWLQAEKTFSQTRYDEIVLDRKAFEIEGDDNIKKTRSAVRLISLLESIMTAYNMVPTMEHQLVFLVDVQLELLNQYHSRLSGAIDSFEALSLIRSVPAPGALPDAVTGVMTASESNGTVSALHRLYRWWTSAKSIIEALKDWEDDELFLGLHYEIKQNPEKVERMASDQDKSKTIRLAKLSDSTDGILSDALVAYDQINKRIEKIFVRIAVKEWTSNGRSYSKKNGWWESSSDNSTEVSNELYTPLQDFRMTFNYLNTILPQPDFLLVYRNTLKEIEDWYWKYIITQNQFSVAGALQLQADLNLGLWKIGQKWVQKPENLTKRLKEAIILLLLPLSSEKEICCQALMNALIDTSQLELVQQMLEKLNIELLSNGQIRDVLRRRNDMLYSWN